MNKILIFLSIIFLSACQYLPNISIGKSPEPTPELETCPQTTNLILKPESVEEISFVQGQTVLSGIAKKNQAIGYSFVAQKGQELEVKTNDDICWWIYAPDNQLFTGKAIATEGKYIIQVSTLKGSKTFNLNVNLQEPVTATPNHQNTNFMIGTWDGYYNINSSSSQLFVVSQSGNQFSGTISTVSKRGGVAILEVEGEADPNSKTIVIRETRVIQKPSNNPWYLGVNRGTISGDLQTISGDGEDTYGYKYTWYFKKK